MCQIPWSGCYNHLRSTLTSSIFSPLSLQIPTPPVFHLLANGVNVYTRQTDSSSKSPSPHPPCPWSANFSQCSPSSNEFSKLSSPSNLQGFHLAPVFTMPLGSHVFPARYIFLTSKVQPNCVLYHLGSLHGGPLQRQPKDLCLQLHFPELFSLWLLPPSLVSSHPHRGAFCAGRRILSSISHQLLASLSFVLNILGSSVLILSLTNSHRPNITLGSLLRPLLTHLLNHEGRGPSWTSKTPCAPTTLCCGH